MSCKGILYCCLCALLSGCASYRIPTPCGEARVVTVFRTVTLPRIEYGLDGQKMTIAIDGYEGGADGKALGAILGAAVKAAK